MNLNLFVGLSCIFILIILDTNFLTLFQQHSQNFSTRWPSAVNCTCVILFLLDAP